MKILIAALAIVLALPALATNHIPTPTKDRIVEVYRDSTRDALVGAAIGAGITYWIMHRRAKRRPPDVRIVPAECPPVQCPQVPTCEVQTSRALATCVAK